MPETEAEMTRKMANHQAAFAVLHDYGIKHVDAPDGWPTPTEAESEQRFDDKIHQWGYLDLEELATGRTAPKTCGLLCRAVDNHDRGQHVDAWNLWVLTCWCSFYCWQQLRLIREHCTVAAKEAGGV